MGTLCAMETIHLLDKEREVESECRVPEKPIARRAQPLPGSATESGGEPDRRLRADPALRRSIRSGVRRMHDIRTVDIPR